MLKGILMKVKTLLKHIKEFSEKYPDFEDWEVYTEQPDLCVPENFRTIEEEIQVQKEDSEKYGIPFNQEYIDYLKESEEKINELKEYGWHFVYTSLGDVLRETGIFKLSDNREEGSVACWEKEKVFGIFNNT